MEIPRVGDLENATAEEIEKLQAHLTGLVAQKRAEELAGKLKRIDDLISELGLSRAQVAAHLRSGKGRKRGAIAPKYRNPSNPAETWAGRGRKPKWVQDHLSNGGKLQELEIAA